MREGPKKNIFTVYKYSCEGCVYLRIADKKWVHTTDCFHPKWDGPFPGRSLGGDMDTPDWCPVLRDRETDEAIS